MDSSEARKTLGWTQGLSRSRLTFDGLELTSLAIGHQASLDRCSFIGTDLRQAVLDGTFFRLCNFRGANLRGSSLRYTRFGGCDLRDVDLRDADLTGANLGALNTGRADVGRTDLTGALLSGAFLRDITVLAVRGWRPERAEN
mgnify:FL=1|jgi:uncharacterized protein YjbI with pentapeptide repeats